MCRKKVQNMLDNEFYGINECFRTRNMNSFWNKIKRKRQNHKANSFLDAQTIADTYKSTMSCNDTPLDQFHSETDKTVRSKFQEWIGRSEHSMFTDSQIDRAICALRKNVSAGIDGITAEYFIYGNSEVLRSHLLSLYNAMFTHTFLPSVLVTGIIIPILKKSTLDPNVANNYRPITLGSTHGKIIEILLMPTNNANPNQFGFRKGRSTSMACILLNDLLIYCSYKNSPVFVCSLDAQKNVSIPYGTRGSFISCLVSFRNRIGCFCTNGINLWNVLFVGTAQLVNPLECIGGRSRAVYYLQHCLIYSLMNYSLNSLHVMQVFALVMTNSTILHTQMMSTYSALRCQACSD